jgi:hypothetical protein
MEEFVMAKKDVNIDVRQGLLTELALVWTMNQMFVVVVMVMLEIIGNVNQQL